MTVLVTGGAGFIGRHVCRRLLSEGQTVACLDNFQTSARADLFELEQHPRFRLLEADVQCSDLCLPEVSEIWHLACPASPSKYAINPIATLLTSVLGTLNMLEHARSCGARMLFTSTSEVYGDPLIHPQDETYLGNVNPTGPRACYDEGKRAAETLCADHARMYGTDVRVVRLFNTYGPGMAAEDGRVVTNFVTQALRNEDITIYGSGSQTRSLCYIDDTVEALFKVMALNTNPGVLNVGSDFEVDVRYLASLIRLLTNSSSCVVYKALPGDDPKMRKPDIQKIKRALGWQPTTLLSDGLLRTIEHFRASSHVVHP